MDRQTDRTINIQADEWLDEEVDEQTDSRRKDSQIDGPSALSLSLSH